MKLTAPAGYGKTTAARAFAGQFDSTAVLDCARADSGAELAILTLRALADETPNRAKELSSALHQLQTSRRDDAQWIDILLNAWRMPARASFFTFENVESIAEKPQLVDLLDRLLRTRTGERVLALCSRTTPALRFSDYLAPHELLTLGVRDLRFTDEEIALAFQGIALAPNTLARVGEISQGWPIAVLFLARLAGEYPLAPLLDDLQDSAFTDLHDYVYEQTLASLPDSLRTVLLACAAIPKFRMEDIAMSIGGDIGKRDLEKLTDQPGLFSVDQRGLFMLHPLVQATLIKRCAEELSAVLLHAAEKHERAGNFLRASELYASRGDYTAAVAALNLLDRKDPSLASTRLAEVISILPAPIANRHSDLWMSALELRALRPGTEYAHYAKLKQTWSSLPRDTEPRQRAHVALRLGFLAYATGDYFEAENLFSLADGLLDRSKKCPTCNKMIVSGRAAVAAGFARFDEAKSLWGLAESIPSTISFRALRYESEIWGRRNTGDWDAAHQLALENLEIARKSGSTSSVAYALSRVALSAWLLGVDDAALSTTLELADVVEQTDTTYADHLRRVADGKIPLRSDELGQIVALESVILLARRFRDPYVYLRFAEDVLRRGTATVHPFFTILVRVICACVPGSDRLHHVREARRALENWKSPALDAALEKLERTPEGADFGVLTSLIDSIRGAWRGSAETSIYVDVLAGEVRYGAEVLHISGRGHELITALALFGEAATKERLIDALWPHLDIIAARGALKTAIHRLRQQLGDKKAIASVQSGYRLHRDVRIDVVEIAQLIRNAPRRGILPDDLRARLASIIDVASDASRRYAESWDWFTQFEAHIAGLHYDAALILARDSSLRNDTNRIFQLSERLIELDRCDETGYELKIRALIESGDRAGAIREYRRCRDALRSDLNVEPSPALADLVAELSA